MTDRDLIYKAAQAAGYGIVNWEWSEANQSYLYRCEGAVVAWNPRRDDCDAFRLALALKLNIIQGDFSAGVNDEADIDMAAFVRDDAERASVVRRLIVEAAASKVTP